MSDSLDYDRLGQALNETIQSVQSWVIAREDVELNDDEELGVGGNGSVWVATLKNAKSGSMSQVAVKILRPSGNIKSRMRTSVALAREVRVWAKLSHPNILPFIGFRLAKDHSEAWLMSPVMKNGNVREYFKLIKPNYRQRIDAVIDMTEGLEYLHGLSPPVCHGDLKPDNLLVDNTGHMLLCDFGLTVVPDSSPSGLTTTKSLKGTVRYLAPELLETDTPARTLSSDIWAWGCVVIELSTDRMPYSDASADFMVILEILKGPPAIPPDMPFGPLVNSACQKVPSQRPDIHQCLRVLNAGTPVDDKRQDWPVESAASAMPPLASSTTNDPIGGLSSPDTYIGALSPGEYFIRNAFSSGALDLDNNRTAPGTPIINFSFHGNANQIWSFKPGIQGYKILNNHGSFMSFALGIEVIAGAAISGNPIGIEWQIQRHGNNYLIVLASNSSLVLDLFELSGANGARIVVSPRTGYTSQTWVIEPTKAAPVDALYTRLLPTGVTYRVRNTYSHKAVDLTNSSSAPGTAITNRSVTGAQNQNWVLEAAMYGYYIKSAANGSYLSFADDVPADRCSPISGNPTPVEWIITRENDLIFIHLASNPNLVLDLLEFHTYDFAGIALWYKNGGRNQSWIFEAIVTPHDSSLMRLLVHFYYSRHTLSNPHTFRRREDMRLNTKTFRLCDRTWRKSVKHGSSWVKQRRLSEKGVYVGSTGVKQDSLSVNGHLKCVTNKLPFESEINKSRCEV